MSEKECFSHRLKELIGSQPISAFARKVDLSEALIRKYLKGSDPGLSKANQIAIKANCSLEWLATGEGYQYRKAEVVDMEALENAIQLSQAFFKETELNINMEKQMKLIVAGYQYLRTIKKPDGYFELAEARQFIRYIGSMCG